MAAPTTLDQTPATAAATVDTSRPFRSVKEAVAIFGERFLAGEIYSPKQAFAFPKHEVPFFAPATPPPPTVQLEDTVKKLETELQETKAELKLLKERESETEVAVASLNAELHRNMSKLARAEAEAAAAMVGRAASPRLGEVLKLEEDEKIGFVFGRKKKEMIKKKKKPIIPLVGDLFSKKKGSSSSSSSSSLHMIFSPALI